MLHLPLALVTRSIKYCGMTAEMDRIVQPEDTAAARLNKHVFLATYMHTNKGILEALFRMRRVPRLYNEDTS